MNGNCFKCGRETKICQYPGGDHPKVCSTLIYKDALENASLEYKQDDIYRLAAEASRQEASCYERIPGEQPSYRPVKPRILEIIEFCKRMGYKRLGFAFCGGVHREASIVGSLFESNGFEVVSVMCKVGGIEKKSLGLTEKDDIRAGNNESACNPIGQAMILNEAKTDFNIVMGLCVGHDSLFLKYSDALSTIFMVKDRVMAHNPLGAIYTINTYCKHLK